LAHRWCSDRWRADPSNLNKRKLKIMTIATPLRSDHDIQTAVEDELEWSPELDAAGIGVATDGGAVSLSGEVTTYLQRMAATRAALRVRGVRTLVDNIVVNSSSNYTQTETDLAKSVQRALESTAGIPSSVTVELNGHVARLAGEVEWNFGRENAHRAIQRLKGIDYVENDITLRTRPGNTAAAGQIEAALERNASMHGTDVLVHVTNTTAKLTGTVRTWAQRRTVENIAWSSPHITDIDNQISVNWF
jgi:osmotically-inducible protein OsmY